METLQDHIQTSRYHPFKIDLIVWKHSTGSEACSTTTLFKIDLIVWKRYDFSNTSGALYRLK